MNPDKTIGRLLLAGAIAILIPYTVLTIIFEYPDILRQNTEVVLLKFHEGSNPLIWTWFAFALAGTPLLPAYMLIGQKFENNSPWVRTATALGVIGLMAQMIGLLRWTFVVPILADTFIHAPDEATKAAVVVAFKTIHQLGGVLLGEHLGQLFTIVWTVTLSFTFAKENFFPSWVPWLGFTSSFVYFLAQAELLATIIPDLPFPSWAGLVGSTLWLLWLSIVGGLFMKNGNIRE